MSHEIEISLTLHETFSITAKALRISFGQCGCIGKSKQDDTVSQSSGVCMTKGCENSLSCNVILRMACSLSDKTLSFTS